MIYVLDASVLVKWFVEEPDTPQALSLITADRAFHTAVASLRCSRLLTEFSVSS